MLEFATADEVSTDTFLSVSAAWPYQEQLHEYLESLLRTTSPSGGSSRMHRTARWPVS